MFSKPETPRVRSHSHPRPVTFSVTKKPALVQLKPFTFAEELHEIPMMEGFPVPDFDFDDEEPMPGLCSPSPLSQHALTEEEYRELVENINLEFESDTPIRCTSNSAVYKARNKSDGSPCAVKITAHKRRVRDEFTKRRELRNNPFLVETFQIHESPTKALLQMELCDGGDISMSRLSEGQIWHLLHDVGIALAELHNEGWMHLDVSPSNILCSGDVFKLADFGTLTRIGEFCEGNEGAGPYVSPEALAFPFGPFSVNDRTDIFSFGAVVLEAATGQVAPRGGCEGYVKLRQGELGLGIGIYKCDCSTRLIDLVNLMLNPNPTERPSAGQIVAMSEAEL
jgi:serine/threonine protein kinase